MKRKLTLRTERLAELTTDEMRSVAAGGADSFSGQVACILSFEQPCIPSAVFWCQPSVIVIVETVDCV
jgi:hypothetical protein